MISRERTPERPSLDQRFRTYRNLNGCQFDWYSPGLPPPLADLLRRPDAPFGAALDLGCGSGAITMSLGHRFRPVVGIDTVESTVTRAKAYRVPRNQRRPLAPRERLGTE